MKFAKSFDQVRPWSASSEVLQARTVKANERCRTFMAAYGSQHELPLKLLQAQGILGQLFQENGEFRFVTPQEIAISLGTSYELKLPNDMKRAWKAVGNAIAPVHAGIGLLQLLQMIDPGNLTMDEFLQTYVIV